MRLPLCGRGRRNHCLPPLSFDLYGVGEPILDALVAGMFVVAAIAGRPLAQLCNHIAYAS